MRIDHGQVEWCDVKVKIGQRQEHGTIGSRVALVGGHIRLDRVGGIAGNIVKRRVSDVELSNPGSKLRCASRSRGHIAVVGADGLPRSIPVEEDLTSRVRQRHGAVLGDGRPAIRALILGVKARFLRLDIGDAEGIGVSASGLIPHIGTIDTCSIGLIENIQGWEVLPDQASLVGRARRDIRSQKSPCPRLGDTSFEPDGHREKTVELTEDNLLASLGGDRLQQQLPGLAGVKMV